MTHFIQLAITQVPLEGQPRISRRTLRRRASRELLQSILQRNDFDNSISFNDNHSLVSNGRQLFWSVSYSENKALAVIASNPIAIDIEIHKERNWQAASAQIWKSTPDNLHDFYRRWTMAEALAKLSRQGLNSEVLQCVDRRLPIAAQVDIDACFLPSTAHIVCLQSLNSSICLATFNGILISDAKSQLTTIINQL